jgi:hypothetical protein
MTAWAVILIIPLVLPWVFPVVFHARVETRRGLNCRVSISWLCGAVRFAAGPDGANIGVGPFTVKSFPMAPPEEHPVPRGPAPADAAGKKTGGLKRLLGYRKHLGPEVAPALLKALRRLWAALHLRVRGEAGFGFRDPCLTGMVYGLCAALGLAGNSGLILTPDFQCAGFRGCLSARGRLFAGRVLVIAASFLLSRPGLSLARTLLRREGGKR